MQIILKTHIVAPRYLKKNEKNGDIDVYVKGDIDVYVGGNKVWNYEATYRDRTKEANIYDLGCGCD